jgi:adenylate cyclase
VTVLFLDIRGFTSLSERLQPREVVDLLNAYFERVVKVVIKHEGVINKFIGDAIMAVFGVPKAVPDPERRAVLAGLEIQQAVLEFNEERRFRGQEVAHFGIGINTGQAIAGNVGSSERMEYTVIGDAVNLAQRLQGQAQAGEVIISTTTLQRVPGLRVEERGAVTVKGKVAPVQVFRVVDASATGAPGKAGVGT